MKLAAFICLILAASIPVLTCWLVRPWLDHLLKLSLPLFRPPKTVQPLFDLLTWCQKVAWGTLIHERGFCFFLAWLEEIAICCSFVSLNSNWNLTYYVQGFWDFINKIYSLTKRRSFVPVRVKEKKLVRKLEVYKVGFNLDENV